MLPFFLRITFFLILFANFSAAETKKRNLKEIKSISKIKEFSSEFPKSEKNLVSKLLKNNLSNKELLKSKNIISKKISASTRGQKSKLLFLRGYLNEKTNEHSQAKKDYLNVLKLNPRNSFVRYRKALSELSIGNVTTALNDTFELEWMSKFGLHDVLHLRGLCYEKLGKEEKAISTFKQARKKNPFHVPTIKKIADSKLVEKNNSIDPKRKKGLSRQLLTDLEIIHNKEPDNRNYSLIYARLLLEDSNKIINPQKNKKARKNKSSKNRSTKNSRIRSQN